MTTLVTQRVHQLADTLAELKVKVRAALATEMANAMGTALRDVLVVVLLDRLVTAARPSYSSSRARDWRDDDYNRDRDQWGDPKDHWADDDDARDQAATRYARVNPEEDEPMPAVPAAAAMAVGVNVGRWWLARKGSVAAAVGIGVLATALGLAGGPVARAVLAVLSTATDVLTAESMLARPDPS